MGGASSSCLRGLFFLGFQPPSAFFCSVPPVALWLFEVLNLLPADGENFGIPVEVSLGVVSQSAASHHVLALFVAADTQQFVVDAHGFLYGELVEFGGSEIASFRPHISEQDAESLARDGDVEDHGEGDFPGGLPECRDVFGDTSS